LIDLAEADLERRFGGLRRLYGDTAYSRLRGAHFVVVGVGGVGSWVAEALARCGVAALTLIDLDHVAESNINRQVQALTGTIGMAKVQALRERIAGIHPGCTVHAVEQFVANTNWPGLLTNEVSGVIDACDQVRAKEVLAAWALASRLPFVAVGAAGGKRRPEALEVADLAAVTHDPLLASLRQRLRQRGLVARGGGDGGGTRAPRRAGLRCVFSREAVVLPAEVCAADASAAVEANLACHGYGSSVMVTAAFGLAAAAEAVEQHLSRS
jgi:tRNA threonylcarbamoyladenosine dehydratase